MLPRALFIFCLIFGLSIKTTLAGEVEWSQSRVDFLHYQAELSLDEKNKAVRGSVTIELTPMEKKVSTLSFSATDHRIYSVSLNHKPQAYQLDNQVLTIRFEQPLQQGESYRLKVLYAAKPKKGFVFHPLHNFSVYHTKNWLVSHEAVNDKSTFELLLHHSAKQQSIGNGTKISETSTSTGQVKSHWRQDTPVPIYAFGFALGRFERLTMQAGEVKVDVFYRNQKVSGLSQTDIETAFRDVPDIIEFMQQKAGFGLANHRYAYVVVKGYMAQEADGFSLVGEKFVKTLLQVPMENWFVAHEIAHEWWGNSVTCENFSHFWLNEGLVQFLVAAYKQHRFGEQAYEQEMDVARARVARAVRENRVAPVAFSMPIPAKLINRTMVYSRGALVFYQLRQELGEPHFWQGLKSYTTQHRGGLVTTDDLQRAFEQSSGRDLTAFFQHWVYGDVLPSLEFRGKKRKS